MFGRINRMTELCDSRILDISFKNQRTCVYLYTKKMLNDGS